MKKLSVRLIFLILIFSSITPYAQTRINLKNPPWKNVCASKSTQVDLNICTTRQTEIADSILNIYFNDLVILFEARKKNILTETKNRPDENDRFLIAKYEAQKEAVLKSKRDFFAFREATTEVISKEYEGGTIQTYISNKYELNLTISQISILINILEEITGK